MTLEPDSILNSVGDPILRLETMVMNRKMAALAGQHRVVQRLSKKINVLRASLGLEAADDEPRPVQYDLKTSTPLQTTINPYDVEWLRSRTAQNVAELSKTLIRKGFSASRETAGDIVTYKYTRANHVIAVDVISGVMACCASSSGHRMPIFEARANQTDDVLRGIPDAVTSDNWDKTLTARDAQQYVVSWRKLLEHARVLSV